MFNYPQLQQIFVGLLNIKIVIIAALMFVSFVNKRSKKYVYFVIAFEFILGFTTFFSSFKEILFYLIIVTVTIYPKIKKCQIFIKVRLCFKSISIIWPNLDSCEPNTAISLIREPKCRSGKFLWTKD